MTKFGISHLRGPIEVEVIEDFGDYVSVTSEFHAKFRSKGGSVTRSKGIFRKTRQEVEEISIIFKVMDE